MAEKIGQKTVRQPAQDPAKGKLGSKLLPAGIALALALLMLPMVLIMGFSIYAGLASADNPDGSLAFWCSILPITSPIVMMVRLPFEVPIWQIALSLILLYLSFVGTSYFGGKIYRVGILMYGKKPSVKELLRWMRYK